MSEKKSLAKNLMAVVKPHLPKPKLTVDKVTLIITENAVRYEHPYYLINLWHLKAIARAIVKEVEG